MSFVTTHPEALAATARNLQAIESALSAQNAAAATPTAGVVPAAADEVSALQATQFAAYGKLYQQVSAQAAAIQQMFIHTLRTSAESYNSTETANAAASSAADSPISDLINLLNGSASGPYNLGGAALSNGSIAGIMQASNFGSAASDLLQLGSSGFLAPGALTSAQAAAGSTAAAMLTGSTEPAAAAASAEAAPVLVSTGQPAAPSALSAPPGWAGPAAPAGAAAAAPIAPAGAASATAHTPAAAGAVPAGLASAAAAERGSNGRLRYGVKPKVAPRATGI